MSNIITMDALRNDCCLCINKGEIDLFEHKVTIENFNDDETECASSEIIAVDLFNIYQNVDILSSNIELKLICEPCLQELIDCHKFYRKIIRTSRQKQRLYEEAQKFQSEQLDDIIIEIFETDDSSNTYDQYLENAGSREEPMDNTILRTTPTEISHTELGTSVNKACFVEAQVATTQNEIDLASRTDSEHNNSDEEIISMPEDERNNSTDCESISFDENIIYQPENGIENEAAEIQLLAQKRPRFKPSREKLGFTGPVYPPHEDASLVVTQFLPVKTQLFDNESNNYEGSLSERQLSPRNLSTVDYTAVEIKKSSFQHMDNGQLEFKNHDLCKDESKEQIFVCRYCPQAFAAAPYLIAHVRKSHVCKYCTKAFVKSLDLYVHIRQVHYQHKCAICFKELSSPSNLRMHIKRVHGILLPAQVALLDYKPPISEKKD